MNFKIKSKIAAIAISIFFILSMMASLTLIPNANAQFTMFKDVPTYSYINVSPNPCGVGQTVTVDFWLAVPIPTDVDATNMTVVVTNPAGTTTTLGPFTSDLTGGTTTHYTPTTTGNYTFQMFYGGQQLYGMSTFGGNFTGSYNEPSSSSVITLQVTNTQATGFPTTPLPTSWWQTPVNAENVQNWYSLTGSWMGYYANTFASTGGYNDTGSYNPFTTAPATSHILWTKPYCAGGVAGGELGDSEQTSNYWTTSQYDPKYAPVIMDGVEYSTWYTTQTGSSQGIIAINLYNGQTLWTINTTNVLRCGMIVNWENINQYGDVGPYILATGVSTSLSSGHAVVSTNWYMYDGMTGQYICQIDNAPSFIFLGQDANGNIIGYALNQTSGTILSKPNEVPVTYTINNTSEYGPALELFNLTAAMQQGMDWSVPLNTVYQWQNGIEWVTQPLPPVVDGISTTVGTGLGYGVDTFAGWSGNTLVLTAGAIQVAETLGWLVQAGINAQTGQLMWIVNSTGPAFVPYTRTTDTVAAADGVFVEIDQATYGMEAFSLATGKEVWQSTLDVKMSDGNMPNTYDTYDFETMPDASTGILYVWALGGDVWAVNMTNGNIIWSWNTVQANGAAGTETPYGIYPLWVFQDEALAGQGTGTILYLSEGHEYSPPLFHGALELALNATTGQVVWDNLGFDDTATAVADGIMTTFNAYDGQIYAYGQGPSKTTISAPQVGVTTATPVTFTGSVTDMSAGASQEAVAANFPNGLPCVSDASMTGFMEAVYEQQPMPTNVTGVPVTFSVLDSNGNYRTIGTTTTNALGDYSFTWTPDIPGNFTIYATFAGTNAYYASQASTGFYASSPTTSATATPAPVSGLASNTTLMCGITAIIVVIIIIGAAILLVVSRKHP